MSERIFISGVQKEFAAERRAVADFIRDDPLCRRFFEVFLFEELPASDRRADEIYLDEVDRSAIYVGLFGDEYGVANDTGISPTEEEFDRATMKGITRLVFIKGDDDASRNTRMAALMRSATGQLIRRRFGSTGELLRLLQGSLVDYLEKRGDVQGGSFEEKPCPGATMEDIDAETVARFVRRARSERQFPLSEQAPVADVLTHLNLLCKDQPSMAALLLFGRDPQRFIPAAELRCMHFHGTEVQRPAPSYQVFKGNLFDQVDRGADFVLSVLNRRVGTRELGAQAPVSYEIPPDAVREAIVNAVVHRDYASAAAVQVSVFADRVEVWNPGALPPGLTPARLREPHGSVARNPRICEALFLTGYIEKYGTGTLMMIRESIENGLPEPDFEQRGGEFVVTAWRDWLTDRVLAELQINERQKAVIAHLKVSGHISNQEYQGLLSVAKRTAHRDLADLLDKGVIERIGTTGKGTYYVLGKGATKGPKGSREANGSERATKGPNVT
ncbi:MAG: ATP-binding protein [Thermoleophilia bacterium]